MTQEEKARAYDKAYKLAEGIHRFSSNCAEIKRMEQIFPELAESEDEKIRKHLIKHFRNKSKEDWNGVPVKSVLSWLEKQEERKIPKWIFDFLEECRPNIGCALGYDERRNIEGKVVAVEKWLEKQGEQKPAWSEEDEDMHYKTIAVINRLCAEGKEYVWSIKTLKKLFYWLKSLKDRVQPKQEWSEEDEEALLRLTSFIEDWDKMAKGKKSILECTLWSSDEHLAERLLNFLNSLRPQNTWKPSDEQIKACKEVYADVLSAKGFDAGTINSELNRLEEQIKKLKEE